MLIDIHIADGTLITQNIYFLSINNRPSYYYNSVYKKYDILPTEFNACLMYYADNVNKFIKIYDKVIDSLNRLETKYHVEIKKTKLTQDSLNLWEGKCFLGISKAVKPDWSFKIPYAKPEQDTINLWKKKDHWIVTKDTIPDLSFKIPIKTPGIYTITADIRISKEGWAEKPKMQAYFWKKDPLNGSQKVHFESKIIDTDSIFKTYTIQLEYPDAIYTELRGKLFSLENNHDFFTQTCEIKNIKIFNPAIKLDTIEIEEETIQNLTPERAYCSDFK